MKGLTQSLAAKRPRTQKSALRAPLNILAN